MPKDDPHFDGYITLKEAAKISGYSADYIGQLIRKGKLRGRQVYTNIAWVTTEEDLRAYLSGEPVALDGGHEESVTIARPSPEKADGLFRLVRVFLWFLLAFSLVSVLLLLYALVTSSDRAAAIEASREIERFSAVMRNTYPYGLN